MRGEMWVKGFFPFPHSISQNFRFCIPARDRAKEKAKMQETGTGRIMEGKSDEGISAQRTIQCESFGNPDTAAGPKARAVFIAAPVYGTANLKIYA
jgi:hypothetical protein